MPETKYTLARIKKTEHGLVAVASTGSEDRQGEVVDASGWELKNYKKNPLILWAHNHEEPAIGMSEKTWVEGTGKRGKLMIKPVLHEVTERARAIKRLVELGIIKSLSVGFKPIDQDGNTFTKQELLEVSFVNVPANAEAQMLAYKSLKQDGFSEDDIRSVGIKAEMPSGMPGKVRAATKAIRTAMSHMEDMMGMMDEKSLDKTPSSIEKLEADMKMMKGKLDTAVKGLQHLNPHQGRSQRLLTDRLALNKAMTRAADKLLEKPTMPYSHRERLVKAIKLAGEKVIVSQKNELNGTNKRT